MKKLTLILTVASLWGATVFALPNAQGNWITQQDNTYFLNTEKNTVVITPYNNDIFQVTTVPNGVDDFALPPSQAAVLQPTLLQPVSFATADEFTLYSPSTIVKVNRSTGKVSFQNQEGKTLISETSGVDNSGKLKSVNFQTPAGDNFYGAGEKGHSLTLNGDTLTLYNRQNYGYTAGDPRINQMGITMPYFASDKGYGILMDDYNVAKLILGKDEIKYESETPKPLSYYFINGNGNLQGVTSNFTLLTGRQNLPPFWSLGYITSKYGYHTQDEALGAIDSIKRMDLPVDGIVFDLYWYGVETDMGRLEWDKKQFPDHKGMLDSLNNMGVHTVLISQPYINKIGAIDNYNTLNEAGMLTHDASGKTKDVTTWVGEAGMFDIANPHTRQWLWNRLKPLTAEGLAGWWGDLGEPEVHPLEIVHANGETAEQFHNVYGNEWSKLIYNGLRQDFPDMRPLLMMRGGTTGLQRYSVFPWTTDVSRSWGGLQPQVNLMLSSGLSGLGYMSSDIGGFAVDPKNNYIPELYLRWLEMGAFTPVLRTHAQFKPEPYHYPQYTAAIQKIIRMRYEWLPYNYTLAYENAQYGYPLARPLNFYHKSDLYSNIQDEYLWGENVLVAPVMTKGARSRKVLFPSGEWVSWHNPALKYGGGKEYTVKAPLGQLPLFVKEGSFIPQFEGKIENTSEYDPTKLTVKYFASDKTTEYTMFEDDRKNPESLQDKQYQLIHFKAETLGKEHTITITSEGSYKGMPEERDFIIEVIGINRPAKVSATNWKYNPATRTLTAILNFTGTATLSY